MNDVQFIVHFGKKNVLIRSIHRIDELWTSECRSINVNLVKSELQYEKTDLIIIERKAIRTECFCIFFRDFLIRIRAHIWRGTFSPLCGRHVHKSSPRFFAWLAITVRIRPIISFSFAPIYKMQVQRELDVNYYDLGLNSTRDELQPSFWCFLVAFFSSFSQSEFYMQGRWFTIANTYIFWSIYHTPLALAMAPLFYTSRTGKYNRVSVDSE